MKARDYARRFNANPTIDTITQILFDFFNEAVALQESRQAETEAAQYTILNEQNQKWMAFARLVEGVKEEGFEEVIKCEAPDVYVSWQQYQQRSKRR